MPLGEIMQQIGQNKISEQLALCAACAAQYPAETHVKDAIVARLHGLHESGEIGPVPPELPVFRLLPKGGMMASVVSVEAPPAGGPDSELLYVQVGYREEVRKTDPMRGEVNFYTHSLRQARWLVFYQSAMTANPQYRGREDDPFVIKPLIPAAVGIATPADLPDLLEELVTVGSVKSWPAEMRSVAHGLVNNTFTVLEHGILPQTYNEDPLGLTSSKVVKDPHVTRLQLAFGH